MLTNTMPNLKRRAQCFPRNVISPQQSSMRSPPNVSIKTINTHLSPLNVTSDFCSPPRRISNYSNSDNPISVIISPRFNANNMFSKTGFSSVKNTIGKSMNDLSSDKNFNQSMSIPFLKGQYNFSNETETTKRISFHQSEPNIQNNSNTIKTTRFPSVHENNPKIDFQHTPNFVKKHSQILHSNRIPSNPEQQCVSLKQNSKKTPQSGNNQYIIQLLAESLKTKQIIEKLMIDNGRLLKQNKQLTIQKDSFEVLQKLLKSQNQSLKQQITILLQQQQTKMSSLSNVDKNQHDIAVSVIEENQVLNNFIDNKIQYQNQELKKIINEKDGEIEELQAYNIELTKKIKELLIQLNRFNDQRIMMVEQHNCFKHATDQQIERLNNLLQSKSNSLKYEIRYPNGAPQFQSSLRQTIHADTRIQISGGYQQLILGKSPSPARIITTRQITNEIQITRE